MHSTMVLKRFFSTQAKVTGKTLVLSSVSPYPKLVIPADPLPPFFQGRDAQSKYKNHDVGGRHHQFYHSSKQLSRQRFGKRLEKFLSLLYKPSSVEFHLIHDMSVKELRQSISREFNSQPVEISLKKSLTSQMQQNKDIADTMKMDELLAKGLLNLKVGAKEFTIIPDPSSLIRIQNKSQILSSKGDQFYNNAECKNIPWLEQQVLKVYIDQLLKLTNNDPKQKKEKIFSKKQLSQDIIKQAKQATIRNLSQSSPQSSSSSSYIDTIQKFKDVLEQEYSQCEETEKKFRDQARKSAQFKLWLGVLVVALQFAGFYTFIYHIKSWDEMEPMTYLLGVFYSLVAIIFYKAYKNQFELKSAKNAFQNHAFTKLCRKNGFDARYKQEVGRNIAKISRILKMLAVKK